MTDKRKYNAEQRAALEQQIINSRRQEYVASLASMPTNPDPSGPGTELKALLKTIGITSTPNCSCNKKAAIMDRNGCDWCEENIDKIDSWLAEEAKKRSLPYTSIIGKTLIRIAIKRARKKQK